MRGAVQDDISEHAWDAHNGRLGVLPYLLGGSCGRLLGGRGLLGALLLGDLSDLGLLLDLGLGGQAVRASVALGVDQLLLVRSALEGEAEVRLAGVADLVLGVDELEDGLARRAAALVQGLNGLLDHSRVPAEEDGGWRC